MKNVWLKLILLLALLAIPGASPTAFATAPEPPLQIVTLKAGVDVDAVIQEFNLKPKFVYRYALHGFAAPMDDATYDRLKNDSRVRAVAANGDVQLAGYTMPVFVPASQLTNQVVPSGLVRMGLTNFPMAHINGQDHRLNVDVAVLDTGVQLDHPDLNVYLPGSASFADGSVNGSDWNGHGTHVAGTIGALDNQIGVVGVAPGVRIWAVQVVGPTQHAVANLLAGVDYIAQHADQIAAVNVSLIVAAGQNYDDIHEAFSNVVSLGVVVVAAAGNNSGDISADFTWGNENDQLPAALPEVMAVSAMDPNFNMFYDPTNSVWTNGPNPTFDKIANFSNYSAVRHDPEYVHSPGEAMDVAAPGVYILSTYKGGDYEFMAGTSMSSPHAAGIVALYIAANGRATNADGVYKIRQAIVDNGQSQTNWMPGGQPAYFYTTVGEFGQTYSVLDTGDGDLSYEPLAMPSENWVPKPDILTENMTAQGFQISFTAVPGYTYTVQATDSLTSSNQWIDLTSTKGEGSAVTAMLTDPTLGATRFYRLMRKPTP